MSKNKYVIKNVKQVGQIGDQRYKLINQGEKSGENMRVGGASMIFGSPCSDQVKTDKRVGGIDIVKDSTDVEESSSRDPKAVFISYSTEDGSFAKKLVAALEEDGFKVWIDDMSIKGGDQIRQTIVDGIRRSRFLVVLLSPDSVNSDWVKFEVSVALSQQGNGGKFKLIPIKLADCRLPRFMSDDLHIIDFASRGFKEGRKALIRSLW